VREVSMPHASDKRSLVRTVSGVPGYRWCTIASGTPGPECAADESTHMARALCPYVTVFP
jgi:hypothetical protein